MKRERWHKKDVTLTWNTRRTSFAVAQELFSGHEVDAGSAEGQRENPARQIHMIFRNHNADQKAATIVSGTTDAVPMLFCRKRITVKV